MFSKGVYEINKNTKKLIRKVKGCEIDYFNFYPSQYGGDGYILFYLDRKNEECEDKDMVRYYIDHVHFDTKEGTFSIYVRDVKTYKTGKTHEKCDRGARLPHTQIYAKKNCRRVPTYASKTKIRKYVTIPYIALKQMDCCVELKYDENEVEKAVRAKVDDCYRMKWSGITMYNDKKKNILTSHFYYLRSRPDGELCVTKMKL